MHFLQGPLKLCKKENPTLQGKYKENWAIFHFVILYVAFLYISDSIMQLTLADINLFCELSIYKINSSVSIYHIHKSGCQENVLIPVLSSPPLPLLFTKIKTPSILLLSIHAVVEQNEIW